MGLRIVSTKDLQALHDTIDLLESLGKVNDYRIELLEKKKTLLEEMCNELKSDGTEYFLEQKILQLEAAVRVKDKRLRQALSMKVWVAFNKAENEREENEE